MPSQLQALFNLEQAGFIGAVALSIKSPSQQFFGPALAVGGFGLLSLGFRLALFGFGLLAGDQFRLALFGFGLLAGDQFRPALFGLGLALAFGLAQALAVPLRFELEEGCLAAWLGPWPTL